jgi:hypothetical protein
MATYQFTSLGAAAKAIARDSKARDKRVRKAVVKAAQVTAKVVAKDIAPKAFGELADSIHWGEAANGAYVIADAPHAEAVEVGSRPHTPPLEPIIAWVRLRGIQGFSKKGNIVRSTTTGFASKDGARMASRSVAGLLSKHLGTKERAAGWRALEKAHMNPILGTSPFGLDSATLAVARAIQHQISVHGTKPQRYMYAGIVTAMAALDTYVKAALEDV